MMAGSMTAYLVFTGCGHGAPAMRAAIASVRDIALMLVALTLGLATFAGAIVAVASPDGRLFGLPSCPFFLFGVLGVVGRHRRFQDDTGGRPSWRAAALETPVARCAWRCSSPPPHSFRSARAWRAILPAPFTTPALRALPVVLVLVAMFYWLWKVRFRRSFSERWPSGGIGRNRTMQAADISPTR